MENAADIKAWAEEQWNGKLLHSGHRNIFTQGAGGIATKAGANITYKSKEQKVYEARFGIYNKKLVPIILAEATRDDRFSLPRYSWPKTEAPAVESVPRKRVSRVKLAKAAQIIEQVPPDQLATFLARFGLSLSLAASIASLDNAEMIARQFLRATL